MISRSSIAVRIACALVAVCALGTLGACNKRSGDASMAASSPSTAAAPPAPMTGASDAMAPASGASGTP